MNDQNKTSVKYRISLFTSAILLFFAFQLEVTELVLDLAGTTLGFVGVIIGYAKDFIALFFFPTFFLLKGAPFWKGRKAKKKIIAMVSSFIISFFPWFGAFMPETLLDVAITIYLTRKEDREKVQKQNITDRNITRFKRVREKIRK